VTAEIGRCSPYQRLLFGLIHGGQSTPEIGGKPGLDFYKNNTPATAEDKVEFPSRSPPVAMPQTITAQEKPEQGKPLAPSPDISGPPPPVHFTIAAQGADFAGALMMGLKRSRTPPYEMLSM